MNPRKRWPTRLTSAVVNWTRAAAVNTTTEWNQFEDICRHRHRHRHGSAKSLEPRISSSRQLLEITDAATVIAQMICIFVLVIYVS